MFCSQRILLTGLLLVAGLAEAKPVLVKIPAGSIEAVWLMSQTSQKEDKGLKKTIQVDSFEIMDKSVTAKEFKEFINKFPEWKKENIRETFADAGYLAQFEDMDLDAPVTQVSWHAARAFCEAQGLRLPTMDEWEYVAAASEKKKNANQDPEFLKRILEWYAEPKPAKHTRKDLAKNRSYKNHYGVYDMHGLIWEWVDDFNTSFVTGESREDSNFNKDMFCGSGSQNAMDKENYAAFMRFALRSSLKGSMSLWNLGFRCAR